MKIVRGLLWPIFILLGVILALLQIVTALLGDLFYKIGCVLLTRFDEEE